MLFRFCTAWTSSACTAGSQKSARSNGCARNLRMVTYGPSTASGGTAILTRLPSARRASTNGAVRSTRKPSGPSIRSMITCKVSPSTTTPVATIAPQRSIHTPPGPLIISSVVNPSASSGSSGPSPTRSRWTRSATTRICARERSGAIDSTHASIIGSSAGASRSTR